MAEEDSDMKRDKQNLEIYIKLQEEQIKVLEQQIEGQERLMQSLEEQILELKSILP